MKIFVIKKSQEKTTEISKKGPEISFYVFSFIYFSLISFYSYNSLLLRITNNSYSYSYY